MEILKPQCVPSSFLSFCPSFSRCMLPLRVQISHTLSKTQNCQKLCVVLWRQKAFWPPPETQILPVPVLDGSDMVYDIETSVLTAFYNPAQVQTRANSWWQHTFPGSWECAPNLGQLSQTEDKLLVDLMINVERPHHVHTDVIKPINTLMSLSQSTHWCH